MMSLHINNTDAKNAESRIICHLQNRTVMHQQQVDMVAGDFNGPAWRRQSGSDSRLISSIEEAFVSTNLPLPTPLWCPGRAPGECGLLQPPRSEADWQIRSHGASTIPYNTLGWVSRKKIKVAVMNLDPPPPRQC